MVMKNLKSFIRWFGKIFWFRKPNLIPQIPKILHGFYDRDLISEEVLIKWGSKVSKKYVPKDVSKKLERLLNHLLNGYKKLKKKKKKKKVMMNKFLLKKNNNKLY